MNLSTDKFDFIIYYFISFTVKDPISQMHLRIMFFWTKFFIQRYPSKCRNLYPFLITLECVDVVRCLHRTPFLTIGHFTLHPRSILVGDASTYICILSMIKRLNFTLSINLPQSSSFFLTLKLINIDSNRVEWIRQ